jgi:hypothetical protein
LQRSLRCSATKNLRIDNFIVPVRIEKLTRSLPILLNTGLYINAENWAAGLKDLVERLNEDGVPKRAVIDFERIASWWPAMSAESVVRLNEEEDLVSNILSITALPETIHLLKVSSEGNPIVGYERLQKALPSNPAHYAYRDFAVAFAAPFDFAELTSGYDFESTYARSRRAKSKRCQQPTTNSIRRRTPLPGEAFLFASKLSETDIYF